MPFQKHANRYRKVARALNRGRKYARPVVNTAILAAKAYTMAKALKRSNNIEYKIAPYLFDASVTWSGAVASMIPISQGLTDSTRVGDSIKLQNLTLRYLALKGGVDSFLRVMVIRDDQNKVSSVSDVLETISSANSVISSKNYDKRFQSKILYDKVHNLNSAASTQAKVDIVIPLGYHAQFTGNTTTVQTGDLKFLAISSVAANTPGLTVNGRITYTDN